MKDSIPKQSALVNHPLLLKLGDNTFFDDDGNNTLSYTASLDDDSPLPTWLKFDAKKKTLTGIPVSSGRLKVKVTATDAEGATAASTFLLTIKNKL